MVNGATRPIDTQTTSTRATGIRLVARLALAAAAIAIMALVLSWVWIGVDVYAQHLCKWPATISCSDGSPVWWLVPLSLGAVAAVGAWGLVTWARVRSHRTSWLVVPWLVGFLPAVYRMRPRQFGPADLWIGVLYVAIGIVLAAAIATESAPAKKRLIIAATLATLAAMMVIGLMLPSILSTAWNTRRA
jgi:hypothetical protein